MNVSITGKVTAVAAPKYGESQNGQWKSVDFIITEQDVQYPESVVMTAWGDTAQKIIDLVADGRIYSGRWTAKAAFHSRVYDAPDGSQRFFNIAQSESRANLFAMPSAGNVMRFASNDVKCWDFTDATNVQTH